MTVIDRTPCPPKERMEGTLRCHSPRVTTGLTSLLSQSVVMSEFENECFEVPGLRMLR